MVDRIEKIHGATVQHGPFNDRIYVMNLDSGDPRKLISELEEMARIKGYGKIFAKIPQEHLHDFSLAGYVKEAEIPRLFNGKTDCIFVSKFYGNRQTTEENYANLYSFVGKAKVRSVKCLTQKGMYNIEVCTRADTQELSLLYRQVFPSYPFPISDPSYLSDVMHNGVTYYCIRAGKSIVAAAAIEANHQAQYAEMTDFATLPECRGKGLAERLLNHMDVVVDGSPIKTVYTIARASSYAMNNIFWKCGYTYSGLLVNNTQISGSIESMSVWHRHT